MLPNSWLLIWFNEFYIGTPINGISPVSVKNSRDRIESEYFNREILNIYTLYQTVFEVKKSDRTTSVHQNVEIVIWYRFYLKSYLLSDMIIWHSPNTYICTYMIQYGIWHIKIRFNNKLAIYFYTLYRPFFLVFSFKYIYTHFWW